MTEASAIIKLLKQELINAKISYLYQTENIFRHLCKAVNEFIANPSFRQEYEEMPTNMLKCHEVVSWAISIENKDEIVNEKIDILLELIERRLTEQEWKYLIDSTPNVTAKINYNRKMMGAKTGR